MPLTGIRNERQADGMALPQCRFGETERQPVEAWRYREAL